MDLVHSLACRRRSPRGLAAVPEARGLAVALANEKPWLRNRRRRLLAFWDWRFCMLCQRSGGGRRERGLELRRRARDTCGRNRCCLWEHRRCTRMVATVKRAITVQGPLQV